MEFIAAFCPNCSVTLNEELLDIDYTVAHHSGPTDLIRGGATCGTCHTRTRSWNHIKTCATRQATIDLLCRQAQADEIKSFITDQGLSQDNKVILALQRALRVLTRETFTKDMISQTVEELTSLIETLSQGDQND